MSFAQATILRIAATSSFDFEVGLRNWLSAAAWLGILILATCRILRRNKHLNPTGEASLSYSTPRMASDGLA